MNFLRKIKRKIKEYQDNHKNISLISEAFKVDNKTAKKMYFKTKLNPMVKSQMKGGNNGKN